jgi:hypothetical protein
MKIIAGLTVIAFIMTGCTTLKPVELSQPIVQERILTGDVIKPGDRVQITTTDGKIHESKVVSITNGIIKGKDMEISVNDIMQVEKRKASPVKTVFLVVGITSSSCFNTAWNSRSIISIVLIKPGSASQKGSGIRNSL